MATPSETLAELLATPAGHTPTLTKLQDIIKHLQNHESDISGLSGGGAPGFGAAIDLRWIVQDSSSSSTAYTSTVTDATGNSLAAGQNYVLRSINQTNTAGAVTWNIGSLDGAVSVKKIAVDGTLVDLDAGDLDPQLHALLHYDGTYWVLMNPVSNYRTFHVSTSDPTGGDGVNGDVWLKYTP